MMLSDEQQAFQESVRAFVKRECSADKVRQSVAAGHVLHFGWRGSTHSDPILIN